MHDVICQYGGGCGVRGGIRTLGPRIHTTSAFAATLAISRVFVVWTVSSPRDVSQGVARTVSTPSYRKSDLSRIGLARDWHGSCRTRAFPDFERIHQAVSKSWRPIKTRNPVLYPAELRGPPGLIILLYRSLQGEIFNS